jgi:SAM-dependent methyltransferase
MTSTAQTWRQVWAARALDPSKGSTLAQLMAADGLDTGFGNVSEDAWREFVRRQAASLGLGAGSTVFEVGCGSGAFLYELNALGCAVAGLDQSPALVEYARAAIPRGDFVVADASALADTPPADVVLSWGVFLYFPSLEYARTVLERMVRKATCAVAIYDLPDAARREEALAFRRGSLGPEKYDRKYAGLDHLYFDRDALAAELRRLGLVDVRVEDQRIDGYANAAFRFNVTAAVRR